jgi:hypothetical protein
VSKQLKRIIIVLIAVAAAVYVLPSYEILQKEFEETKTKDERMWERIAQKVDEEEEVETFLKEVCPITSWQGQYSRKSCLKEVREIVLKYRLKH